MCIVIYAHVPHFGSRLPVPGVMLSIEIRDEETGKVLYSKKFDPNVEKQTERSITIDGEIDSLLQEVQEVLAQAADLDER